MPLMKHCLLWIMLIAIAGVALGYRDAGADMFCVIQSGHTATTAEGQTYNGYSVKINGAVYLAFQEEAAHQLLEEISRQRQKIEALQKQLETKEQKLADLKTNLKDCRELNKADAALVTELTEIKDGFKDVTNDYQFLNLRIKKLMNGYDELSADYKKISKGYSELAQGSQFAVEAGLGIMGSDNDPAVLLGIGIRRFRAWGFFHKEDRGALLGISLPVY